VKKKYEERRPDPRTAILREAEGVGEGPSGGRNRMTGTVVREKKTTIKMVGDS